MPNQKDKKNGKNGKKKTLPVKPPTSRRGNGNKEKTVFGMDKKKTEKAIRETTKKLEPADARFARKIMTQPSFRKEIGNAILTGLTFGLYKP
jgi:hypothetical protein|tara:strand:+ start:203 stop:478 length:276 start_codon:yes stop_codon:yes gene_type:complete